MIENPNSSQSLFSNEGVKKILSWTEQLVSKTGIRFTGTTGSQKASEIIYQKLKVVCNSVIQQDFGHHRDAFLSFAKLMSISYTVALLGLWFDGVGNYVAAIVLACLQIAHGFDCDIGQNFQKL